MNRARVFVQEMFGHNDRHKGANGGYDAVILIVMLIVEVLEWT